MVAAVAFPVTFRKLLRVNTWVSSLNEVAAFCNDSFKVSTFQGARKSEESGWYKVSPRKGLIYVLWTMCNCRDYCPQGGTRRYPVFMLYSEPTIVDLEVLAGGVGGGR
jgi:hypothetical protein